MRRTLVFSRVTPKQKLDLIELYKASGQVVPLLVGQIYLFYKRISLRT